MLAFLNKKEHSKDKHKACQNPISANKGSTVSVGIT